MSWYLVEKPMNKVSKKVLSLLTKKKEEAKPLQA